MGRQQYYEVQKEVELRCPACGTPLIINCQVEISATALSMISGDAKFSGKIVGASVAHDCRKAVQRG